ncbi:MAG: 30S ribosomal protein THX [Bacteroidota bacterium]
MKSEIVRNNARSSIGNVENTDIRHLSPITYYLSSFVQQEHSMGKGDRRSRKSKIWRGTFGKTRPRHRRKKKTQKAKPT